MTELWIAQAVHLSIGQAVVLLALSVGLISAVFYYQRMEK